MNKIIKGNCFDVMKTLSKNDNIKLVLTDPPYLHNKGGGKTSGTEGKSKIANSAMYKFDSFMMEEMSSFGEDEVYNLLDEYKRIMNKMNCFIFCNDTLIPYYTMWAVRNKKKFTVLTWEKPLSILNRNRFSQNLEYCVRIYDNGTALNLLDIDKHPHKKNYYSKTRKLNTPKNKQHPTQKPLEYLKGIIELTTNKGDVVLDTFFGSGSTGVACLELERNFIGIELTEKYFNISTEVTNNHKIQTKLF
jgi:DNA modification methylase